jgi:hypothetical protein
MPTENRRGSHDEDSLEEEACSRCQGRDQPAVQSAEPGTRRRAAEHDELVAKQQVLGGDDGARREESRGGGDYVAKEVDHGGILGNLASRSSCAAPLHPPESRIEFQVPRRNACTAGGVPQANVGDVTAGNAYDLAVGSLTAIPVNRCASAATQRACMR